MAVEEVFVVGTSQSVAPVAVREKLHVDLEAVYRALGELLVEVLLKVLERHTVHARRASIALGGPKAFRKVCGIAEAPEKRRAQIE